MIFLQFSLFILLSHFNSSLVLFTCFLNTFTLHVDTSTFIAELKLTLARHVVTSIILLHPKFAFRALFELFALYKIKEHFIIFWNSSGYFVFGTRHSIMPIATTIQAVLFFTLKTLESDWITFFIKEHVSAISSGTGWDWITVHVSIGFQSMILVLFVEFFWQNCFNISFQTLSLAFLVRTLQWEAINRDLRFEGFNETLLMKTMTTIV